MAERSEAAEKAYEELEAALDAVDRMNARAFELSALMAAGEKNEFLFHMQFRLVMRAALTIVPDKVLAAKVVTGFLESLTLGMRAKAKADKRRASPPTPRRH